MNARKLIAGNWKMNGGLTANARLMDGICTAWAATGLGAPLCDTLVCVPGPFLMQMTSGVAAKWASLAIKVGAQDVSAHAKGAYTGEVSASMLAELGVSHVIVGHSERRRYHGESNAAVAAKALAAQSVGLIPIVCVGESLAERDAGTWSSAISTQLQTVLQTSGLDVSGLVVAYEPVWAVGTGRTATPAQAQEAHAVLRTLWRSSGCEHGTILYGGSMNAANAAELLAQPDVGGGLIGGAALKSDDFTRIMVAAHQQANRSGASARA